MIMTNHERVKFLNETNVPAGRPIVYWMQSSVRTSWNHALEYAVHLANHRRQPVHVVFCLMPDYPAANIRHYQFLLEGLRDVQAGLAKRGVGFSLWLGNPDDMAAALRGIASTVVTDRGYLRHQRRWRTHLAAQADCPVVQVESDVVVPVETASIKEEYTAATLRPKILRERDRCLSPPTVQEVDHRVDGRAKPLSPGRGSGVTLVDLSATSTPEEFRRVCPVDMSVQPSEVFLGGEVEAHRRLNDFLENRLSGYGDGRNFPDRNHVSHMSAYLHFGHISPGEIAWRVIQQLESAPVPPARKDVDTLLEELIVRRELSMNYCEYSEHYDSWQGLPQWARTTLEEHATDPRPYSYSDDQLTAGETDDPYWNACQREMVITGKMHGYMRMYWGKKIIEWNANPEEAYEWLIRLNDTYELDGRDPNGYAGVAWVFGKHDRPWVERPIFGKIRYMNDNGLRRKFKNIDDYVRRWTEAPLP